MAVPPRLKPRRLLRCSLRAMFIVVIIFGVWLAGRVNRLHQRQQAIALVERC